MRAPNPRYRQPRSSLARVTGWSDRLHRVGSLALSTCAQASGERRFLCCVGRHRVARACISDRVERNEAAIVADRVDFHLAVRGTCQGRGTSSHERKDRARLPSRSRDRGYREILRGGGKGPPSKASDYALRRQDAARKGAGDVSSRRIDLRRGRCCRRAHREVSQARQHSMSHFKDLIDLAAERLGGAVLAANDEFFAPKEALLRAGPAEWREGEYTD